MFCPKCGRMNDDNDTNCKGCGALLHEETEEKEPQKKGIGIKSVISIAVAAAVAVGGRAGACRKGESFRRARAGARADSG